MQRPITISPCWTSIFNWEIQLLDTSRLVSLLADKYGLTDTNEGLPLIQRFATTHQSEIEGVVLDNVQKRQTNDQLEVTTTTYRLVLPTRDYQRPATIRDAPAIAIGRKADTPRDIEYYTACSLSDIAISYGIKPVIPVGSAVNLVKDIITQLGEQGHGFPNELLPYVHLLQAPTTTGRSWGQPESIR